MLVGHLLKSTTLQGAFKDALSRLIPRRRRRSTSSRGSSGEEDIPPQFAHLPIFDASELGATAVRARVDGIVEYRDREVVAGRLGRAHVINTLLAARLRTVQNPMLFIAINSSSTVGV
ncbi:hypothetical protein R3P38DRAFT_2786415 [Favolaschia claudopus]|uniref:Uncharacterized protein n=1 Tax=Favolaschia claudopus TaxID=2862362 RepID=A0AAW0ARJ8_9AGAR